MTIKIALICTLALVCAIMVDSSSTDVYLKNAETYFDAGDVENSLKQIRKCLKMDPDHKACFSLYKRVKKSDKLREQLEEKDYYKILGVERDADQREIIKAYRKMAQKWHPDKFQDEDEKKHAQNFFIRIAAAKDVLSDAEKREQFDRGEDPLDSSPKMHQQEWQPFQFHRFGGRPSPNMHQQKWQQFQGGFPFPFQFQRFGERPQQFTFRFR